MAITAITSVQEFDEKVLGSKGLAIVDFWAAWCEPCTVMRTISYNTRLYIS